MEKTAANKTKLAFFRIGKGDFSQGFEVSLRISESGSFSYVEYDGRLPKAPELEEIYNSWQSNYSRLDKGFRAKAVGAAFDPTTVPEACRKSSARLVQSFKTWLGSSADGKFQRLREKLSRDLGSTENEVRVFVQTENEILKKLPWHEWDLFAQTYTKAETVLSPLEIEGYSRPAPTLGKSKVRILAILGNSKGIKVAQDRAELERLPDAEILFLEQPRRRELSDRLWEQDWDILFFAGHSRRDGDRGKIYINETEALTVEDLKHGLRKTSDRGLQLAIFNSCDGLKLAENLADLQIPQTIVMREQVPDAIAQEFLKRFLSAFSGGKSLYLAVREARERLQDEGLNAEFPGAAWLPAIYQNPAAIPPTWQELVFSPGTWQLLSSNTVQFNSEQGIGLLDGLTNEFRTFASKNTGQMGVKVTFSPDGQYLAYASEERIDLLTLNGETILKLKDSSPFWDVSNWYTEPWFTAVAISPDGRAIVGVGHNKIRIWRRETGERLHSCAKNMNPIRGFFDFLCLDAVAFSPDGQMMAINEENNISLWNPDTGKRLHELSGHKDLVTSLAFSPDGKIIISGSYDKTIIFWNAETRKQLGLVTGHDNGVYTVAFSPDGQTFASGSKDNTIKLWRPYSGELPRTLVGHSEAVFSVAFSPDGKILASGSADGTIKMWRVSTGELIETLSENHLRGATSVAFSPDARYLASGDRNLTVRIWQRH